MRGLAILTAVLAGILGGLLSPGRASADGPDPRRDPRQQPAAVPRPFVPGPQDRAARFPSRPTIDGSPRPPAENTRLAMPTRVRIDQPVRLSRPAPSGNVPVRVERVWPTPPAKIRFTEPLRGSPRLGNAPDIHGAFFPSPLGPAVALPAGVANDSCENIVQGLSKVGGMVIGGVVGGGVGYGAGGRGGLGGGILVGVPLGQIGGDAAGNFIAAAVCKDRPGGEPTPPRDNGTSLDEIIGPVSPPPSGAGVDDLLSELTAGQPDPSGGKSSPSTGMSDQEINDLVDWATTPGHSPPPAPLREQLAQPRRRRSDRTDGHAQP